MKTRAKKSKSMMTNDELFNELFKEIKGTIHTALLRERMLTIAEATKEWAESEIAEPSQMHFVEPRIYLELAELIQKHLGFND